MLKISVAVTSFNGEENIPELLISLKNQIRKPDEIIFADDASTDCTADIIEDFIKENELSSWKLIRNKENLGNAMNFRKALSNSSGDVIFLCTQNDIWYEDKIESISSLMAGNENIVAVNCAHEMIDTDGNDMVSDRLGETGSGQLRLSKTDLSALFNTNTFPCGTLAVRREIADKYIRLSKCELKTAFELECVAAAMNGLYFYDAPLIRTRVCEGISDMDPVRSAEFQLKAAKAILTVTGADKFCLLCESRLNALKTRSFLRVLLLHLKRESRKLFPLRVRFSDICYTLKSDKNTAKN